MAILQTNVATGRETYPVSDAAGDVVSKATTYTFAVAATNGDIVEMVILPARHVITGLRYVKTGAVTEGNIGIMAGTVGDTVAANRAIATNLITTGRDNDAAFAVTPVEYDRAIGVLVTAAAQGASITLQIKYAQG